MDLSQYKLSTFSDLNPFYRSDPDRWLEFTRYLNEHIERLGPGQRLYISDIVKPVSYNATVKWFGLRSFVSHANPHEVTHNTFVRYDLSPDCTYLYATLVKPK